MKMRVGRGGRVNREAKIHMSGWVVEQVRKVFHQNCFKLPTQLILIICANGDQELIYCRALSLSLSSAF